MGARALIVGGLLFAAACQGPRPTVDGVTVRPGPLPGRYRVEATVKNRSRGEGQVDVRVQLREPASGRVVEDDRNLELHGHETAHFIADVEAPPGQWEPRVTVEYPPK